MTFVGDKMIVTYDTVIFSANHITRLIIVTCLNQINRGRDDSKHRDRP